MTPSPVDLTIRGNNTSQNRMITDQTLDREGFCLPEPPQRCNRRVKSAVGIGKRELNHKPFGKHLSTVNRPKSAHSSLSKRQTSADDPGCVKDQIKIKKENNENENDTGNQKEINHENFIKAKKMTVNQKWLYQGENRKWKPRNSQVRENQHSRSNQSSKEKDMNLKQRISVCEVMAKMQRSDSPDHSNGASAPPSSPKFKASSSAIVGQKFVSDPPSSPQASNNRPNYLHYAKSKHRTSHDKNIPRKSVSFLQEDMTVTNQPSGHRDGIHVPTNSTNMFSTDEPDEESEVVVENVTARPRATPATRTQNNIYKSVYLNDYRAREPDVRLKESVRLERPKSIKQVRYCPNTYRFHDQQYTRNSNTRDFVQNVAWDRVQPRYPVGNSRSISCRRPSDSLYVGTS
ncbi:uncharacterized protein LOC134818226 [Bolinopsis microptera]|uniref:uncharacterized protein LOC134818226 n=1 Tax=Bolinopsis microptera TaxID=2820187 RepID=UPI00307930E0